MRSTTSALLSPNARTCRGRLRLVHSSGHIDPIEGATPTTPIRVLIADAQPLMRAGYRALLERAGGIDVVAEAADGQEAVALAISTAPDVALLDEQLAVLDGLDDLDTPATLASHPAFTGVAVVLMASFEGEEQIFSALRGGAVGVLCKDDEPAALIDSVRLLAQGQALLPASAVRRLLGELRARTPHHAAGAPYLDDLTEREREVVALAAEGLTNGEIADRLDISPATAKTHVSRAMVKLHARHRAELVVCAYENGLVLPREPSLAVGAGA